MRPSFRVWVVGGDQGGEVVVSDDVEEFVEDHGGCGDVQVAGGFVCKEEHGGVGEGSGYGDALLFAAGEFAGVVAGAGAQAEAFQDLHGSGFGGLFVFPFDHLGEDDVFECGELGQQMVELVDEADGVSAYGGAFAV
eukprot:gene2711-2749_t